MLNAPRSTLNAQAQRRWRDIQNVQFVSCLNPTAGSFFIDPRFRTRNPES
jgi:hypothetical protein